tara:strand:+ start:826 stop:1422 length:597 start_codon:yes stop_codon:yes gene_type:complete
MMQIVKSNKQTLNNMAGNNCPPERRSIMDGSKININHEAARLGYYGQSNESLNDYIKQLIINKYGDQVSELKNDIEILNTSLKVLIVRYNKLENLVKYNDFNSVKSAFRNFVIFIKHNIFLFNKWVCSCKINRMNKRLQDKKCKLDELKINIENKCIERAYQIQYEYELGGLARKEQVSDDTISDIHLNGKEDFQYAA